MILSDLLEEIHNQYVLARSPIFKAKGIDRGRSRTISGVSEDLFAYYLRLALDNNKLHFFVDQPLSIDNKKTFYPDVIISKDLGDNTYEILYMVDMKTDIGYHRNISGKKKEHSSYLDKANELKKLNQLLIESKNISSKNGTTKSNIHFIANPGVEYQMVVITAQNAGSKDLSSELLRFSADDYYNITVLDKSNYHPNEYSEPTRFEPNYNDWERLLKNINQKI